MFPFLPLVFCVRVCVVVDDSDDDDDGGEPLPSGLRDAKLSRQAIAQHLASNTVQRVIRREFHAFLRGFTLDARRPHYIDALERMMANNSASIEIDWAHLSHHLPWQATWLAQQPETFITIYNNGKHKNNCTIVIIRLCIGICMYSCCLLLSFFCHCGFACK